MVILIILFMFIIPVVMVVIYLKSLDKNITFKSYFSPKSRREEISIVKDVIDGQWTSPPERIFCGTLRVSGKYKGREIHCQSIDGYFKIKRHYDTILFMVKTHVDICEKSLIEQKTHALYFGVVGKHFLGSSGYSVDEFSGEFTVQGLVEALRGRGINLPEDSEIEYINDNILTDKGLYKKYSELIMAQENRYFIDNINNLNKNELMGFNRRLIDQGDPKKSPKILYIGANIWPLTNFFSHENIKNLLDNLLIVVESIENKNIDNAINAWKNASEKCFFRNEPVIVSRGVV